MKTADLRPQHNITAATFYAWEAKFGGLEVNEAQELKRIKEENSKLKREADARGVPGIGA